MTAQTGEPTDDLDARIWALLQSDVFKAAVWEEAHAGILALIRERESAVVKAYAERILERVSDFPKRMDEMTQDEVLIANVANAIVGDLVTQDWPLEGRPR